jgi:hypothetical protein
MQRSFPFFQVHVPVTCTIVLYNVFLKAAAKQFRNTIVHTILPQHLQPHIANAVSLKRSWVRALIQFLIWEREEVQVAILK